MQRKEQVTIPARERRPAADDRGRGSDDPPAPLQGPPRSVPMNGAVGGGDTKFYLEEHRGKTYQWVLDNRPDYIQCTRQQVNPSQGLTQVMTWVERNFIEGDSVVMRAAVNQPPGEYQPRPHGRAAPRKPPHPPLPERCAGGCSDFSYAGSTAYTVRMTCRTCGQSTTARRNENFTHTPDSSEDLVLSSEWYNSFRNSSM